MWHNLMIMYIFPSIYIYILVSFFFFMCMQVWCSVYSIPRCEDSNFIAVFNPHTQEKKLQYSKLDNRVSVILSVNNSVSACLLITFSQLPLVQCFCQVDQNIQL